jgi:hypothetical protein
MSEIVGPVTKTPAKTPGRSCPHMFEILPQEPCLREGVPHG